MLSICTVRRLGFSFICQYDLFLAVPYILGLKIAEQKGREFLHF